MSQTNSPQQALLGVCERVRGWENPRRWTPLRLLHLLSYDHGIARRVPVYSWVVLQNVSTRQSILNWLRQVAWVQKHTDELAERGRKRVETLERLLTGGSTSPRASLLLFVAILLLWEEGITTLSQMALFLLVGIEGEVAISEAARRLGTTERHMQYSVQRLVELELIARSEHPEGAKQFVTILSLTPSGKVIFKALTRARKARP